MGKPFDSFYQNIGLFVLYIFEQFKVVSYYAFFTHLQYFIYVHTLYIYGYSIILANNIPIIRVESNENRVTSNNNFPTWPHPLN